MRHFRLIDKKEDFYILQQKSFKTGYFFRSFINSWINGYWNFFKNFYILKSWTNYSEIIMILAKRILTKILCFFLKKEVWHPKTPKNNFILTYQVLWKHTKSTQFSKISSKINKISFLTISLRFLEIVESQ